MAKTALQLVADAVAKKHKLTIKESEKFVSQLFEVIQEGLHEDKIAKVKGLGTFKVQAVKPRESINVNTGERVLIAGHDKVSFTPDAAMKELVNKPFAQFETVVLNDGVEFDNEEVAEDAENQSVEEEKTLEKVSETATPLAEKAAEKSENIVEKSVKTEENNAKIEQKGEQNTAKKVKIPTLPPHETPIPRPEQEQIEQPKAVEQGAQSVEKEEKSTEKQFEKAEHKMQTFENEAETTDDLENEPTNSNKKWWIIVAILAIVVLAFFGYQYGKDCALRDNILASFQEKTVQKPAEKPSQTAKKVKATAPIAPKKADKKAAAQAPQPVETNEFKQLSADRRIRYGAYDIVGIEKVVVLKKGQTMESYSRKTLGPDMVGYFQVLNNAETMSEGDTMKIPKVKLRPEYIGK